MEDLTHLFLRQIEKINNTIPQITEQIAVVESQITDGLSDFEMFKNKVRLFLVLSSKRIINNEKR